MKISRLLLTKKSMLPALLLLPALPGAVRAGQPLETESTRLTRRGAFQVAGGFERQPSTAGSEAAFPFAVEYGITDLLEMSVEPVFYNHVQVRGLRSQGGPRYLEATLTALRSPERTEWLFLAPAGEVKRPTARNSRIGAGKTAHGTCLIASKRRGARDTHANMGFTQIASRTGSMDSNQAGGC